MSRSMHRHTWLTRLLNMFVLVVMVISFSGIGAALPALADEAPAAEGEAPPPEEQPPADELPELEATPETLPLPEPDGPSELEQSLSQLNGPPGIIVDE